MRAQIVTFSQDFCHHGDTICHPKSSYITTKLKGMSTCGCNNNAICSNKAIYHVSYRRRMSATLNWPQQSTGGACQSSEMAAVLNSLSFVFKNVFLPKSVVFLCSRVNDTMFKCLEPVSVKRLVFLFSSTNFVSEHRSPLNPSN